MACLPSWYFTITALRILPNTENMDSWIIIISTILQTLCLYDKTELSWALFIFIGAIPFLLFLLIGVAKKFWNAKEKSKKRGDYIY